MLYRPQLLIDGEWQSINRTMSDHLDKEMLPGWFAWVSENPTERRMYSSE